MPTVNAKRQKLKVVQAPATEVFTGKYQALFDQASDAILTLDMDGVDAAPRLSVDEGNQAFQEMTGYPKVELARLDVSAFCPDAKKHHIPERSRPLQAGMFQAPGTYEDIAVLRKDGYVRLVDLSVRHVRSPEADGSSKRISLALFRDVTEKKNMERELITKHAELRNAFFQLEKSNMELKAAQETLVQAGKMAALGELAAGIAHELNQPLQGIRGYAQEMQAGADAETCLKEIVSNVDKMAKIIHYLRTFTRKSVEGYEMTDVHAAIEESLKMLSRQFASRGISVHRDFSVELPRVYANPVQLEQVFINLATNARDAIEASGKGSGNVWIRTRMDGKFVEIVFKDDGCGMSEMTKSKAFNPFFTTKEVGQGMGLGLSLSYGILSKLQASVVVQSELGKGAAFIVRLPVDFRELG